MEEEEEENPLAYNWMSIPIEFSPPIIIHLGNCAVA